MLALVIPLAATRDDEERQLPRQPQRGADDLDAARVPGGVFVLRKCAFPRISEALDKRQRAIEESIETAERARTEAAELLEEYRERLREARAQAEEIIARARKAGEVARARAVEEARAQARGAAGADAPRHRGRDAPRDPGDPRRGRRPHDPRHREGDPQDAQRGRPEAPGRGGPRRARLQLCGGEQPQLAHGRDRPGLRARAVRGRHRARQARPRRASSSASSPMRSTRTASCRCSSSRPTSPPRRRRTACARRSPGADRAVVNFLSLLLENHRMPVIFRVRREYDRLWDDAEPAPSGPDHERRRARPVGRPAHRRRDRRADRAYRGADEHASTRSPGWDRRARRELHHRRLHPHPTREPSQAGRAGLSARPRRSNNFAMQIKPDEITSILKSRIEGLDAGSAELTEVGTVLSVADGIARVHGLENCRSLEMLELPHGVTGLALNLESDNVGVVLFGDWDKIVEGDTGQAHRPPARHPGGRGPARPDRRPARPPARRQGRHRDRRDAPGRDQGPRRRPAPAGQRSRCRPA